MEYRFTRRRYGRRTYTWAEVKHNGMWLDLGDPWPCRTPKREELDNAARLVIDQLSTQKEKTHD